MENIDINTLAEGDQIIYAEIIGGNILRPVCNPEIISKIESGT